ncbi:MAG TPA: PD-(D/E)XK nuclease family protein, partial [Flavisolibacter sp.]|nr:PD-(D/E)XK nuclease family protein [Flavisolibacter sp.]
AKAYPGVDVLVSRFQWHLHNNREVFTPESLKRYHEYGAKCLVEYHKRFFTSADGNDFIRTEVPMEAVVHHIPLKGFADKIQYWGNDIIITDFKTGKLTSANKYYQFAVPGHPKRPEGGDYWRQAAFYKILIQNAPGKKKNILSTEFVFVEPNADNEFDRQVVNITAEHEQVIQQQIKDTWEKIQAHDFYTGCGKPDCEWCNFVKDHKLYKTLHEVDEDAELLVMPELTTTELL